MNPWFVFLGGLSLTAVASFVSDRSGKRLADRIQRVAGDEEEQARRRPVTAWKTVRQWLTRQSLTERIQRDLNGAGIALQAEEFIVVVVGTTLVLPIIAFVLTMQAPVALLMAVFGYFGPWRLVRMTRQRRKQRLEVQLADALTLIAAALRSGHTAVQSMEVATQQLPPPISEEFGQVIFAANIGMPVSEALQQLAERVQSYEYDMMVSAITIQLEVGGSITDLLDSIAATIRDRAALRDEMKALTAQGRLSGILLSGMPVVLFGLTYLINRPYANILLQDPIGQKILYFAISSEAFGWLIMRRILNVRV